jgi:DNA-binding CsgD family transcriptional regulator
MVLTKREKEILYWMAEGYSIKELADKLCVTESTITNHRKNIMRKANAKNVAQLIAYSIRNGII